MPSIPPICQHHGQLLSGTSLADPRGSLLLIVVLYIPVIFTYSPVLLPCFWKAKLLLSVLVCIPWEWSLGSVLPSCRLCFSSFSKYDGWKSSGGVGWVPLRPRLLVANLPQVPAREVTSHYLAHLCSPWGWYDFKRKQTKADIRGKPTWQTWWLAWRCCVENALAFCRWYELLNHLQGKNQTFHWHSDIPGVLLPPSPTHCMRLAIFHLSHLILGFEEGFSLSPCILCLSEASSPGAAEVFYHFSYLPILAGWKPKPFGHKPPLQC